MLERDREVPFLDDDDGGWFCCRTGDRRVERLISGWFLRLRVVSFGCSLLWFFCVCTCDVHSGQAVKWHVSSCTDDGYLKSFHRREITMGM